MTPQQLKNSILQLAIQGKLVEQIPSEGTGEELYVQIQDKKKRLIVEKKIKKEKPLATIKEEEIPFDIPSSWKWCRIGEVGTLVRGSGIKRDEVIVEGKPCVRYGEIYTTYNERFETCKSHIPDSIYETCKTFNYGDVVFTLTGENKPDIAKAVAYMGKEPVAASGDMAVWTNHFMNPMFLVYLFASPYMIEQKIKIATGFIIVHISCKNIQNIVIPLPPLAEQNRIVDRIQQLFKLVDRYGEAWAKLEAFNHKFPEDMKKSILQQAIQGRLVEQRTEEGSAEELYHQIQDEKQKLIAKKLIKKEKVLDSITVDEIPFDIPDNWKWVKVGDIFALGTGSTPLKSEKLYYENGNIPWVTSSSTGCRYIDDSCTKITQFAVDDRNLTLYEPHTLVVAMYGQGKTRGQVSELRIQATINQACCALGNILKSEIIVGYTYWYFIYNYNSIRKQSEGSAQPNLNMDKIRNIVMPLPPLGEQKRIVEKIEELLILCDTFIK